MSFFTILGLMFPKAIMSIFVFEPQIIEMGIPMVRIVFVSLLFNAVSYGISIAFMGSGYNFPYSVSSIVSKWIFQIPIMYWILKTHPENPNKIWYGVLVAAIVEMIINYYYYQKKTWIEKRV